MKFSMKVEPHACMHYLAVLPLLTVLLQGAEAQQEPAADNYYNEARLISDLFLTNPDADVIRLLRPPGDNNGTGPLTVYLGYPSLILSNVDEKSGYITLSLSESTAWNDSRLSWSLTQYPDVMEVFMPPKYVWKPDINYGSTVTEINRAVMDPDTGAQVAIYPDGSVYWTPKREILYKCNFDLLNFPFDNQTCVIEIGTWVHQTRDVDVKLTTWKNINPANEHHSDWTVDSIDLNVVTETVLFDEEYPEYYQTVYMNVSITRKSEFYYYIFVVPMRAITWILPFLHLHPPNSSHKSLMAGLLLVLTFILHAMLYFQLQSFTDDKTPKLVAQYDVGSIMCIISIGISSATSFLANTTHSTQRVPLFIRNLMKMTAARICWFGDEDDMNGEVGSYDRNKDTAPVITTTPLEDEHQGYPEPEAMTAIDRLNKELRRSRLRQQTDREWYQLALVVDRITALIFLLFTIIYISTFKFST